MSRTVSAARLLLAALIVFMVGVAACSATEVPVPTSEPTLETFRAPDFTLATLGGDAVTLSALRGRWVLINFWATWCVPCVEEMPALGVIAAERTDMLTLLGINVREDEAAVRAFVQEHAIAFPILINPPDALLIDYVVTGLPQTLVVRPDGEVVWRTFGPVEQATFDEVLDQLLQTSA